MAVEELDKRRLAQQFRLYYKICRSCGARNSPRAEKCRQCKSKNLRWKKREIGMKK
ncbi:MAG: 50S ribosomal protein L40e [Candidatus Geothermarchaeales archaeon]